ncbi:Transcription termination protein NusB [Fructilactobacillus florum 8D]|uniref:Transcription antitermination protein NusB n=2 Tax=Fructilactobacillus florum TaxID=640331 RepID=W9EDH6_9LACO|nr:transcription antitermination factor NusB [Fructilactobacillus florum]EKK20717.1 Transcription termination protein NusB [Fructilactobacillus florum 2F]ETO40183.1 Transcription termination protein NusB [Fructilactobacillus florum 8D]KRM91799.1 N utilization substance protein B [Fructilactobacillus florum DSM 22689 = JCM 16035]
MKINRHQIRERAFQTLFAQESNPELDAQEFYQQLAADDNQAIVPPYFQELVKGVHEHQPELRQQLQEYLASGWQLDRISRPALVILELALFEIKFVTDLPPKVAINEALELAKKYSDEQTVNFVNAVLDRSIK